ncbi:TetR/AcrR family transcriptional regulator [Carboxylicivirga sediminis]|uniref:TetR/AcrR family transcriptional regulator n=1 Tax=Carboxylicivirga sediminis TaxID=2006564 RepID=A0A941J0K7_9BACT|nr:TetR/AcrR family transcriptional regulator [Carboxylicivirga sediminis]MBR8538109.1 TetR/AcrR family transcriptional regulator [Carboxylicivirga sediminis]
MKSKDTFSQWLEVAYIEFAHYGPEFSLKALAKKTNLPRATFYYHFDDKEHLISELLQYHKNQIHRYQKDLKNEVKELIPDLYQLMFNYKHGIMFHQQLFIHCDVEAFYRLYKDANETSIKILLPLIKALFDTDKTDREIIQFYHILTDAWYIRLNAKQFTVESMINLATDIMENTLGLCVSPYYIEVPDRTMK